MDKSNQSEITSLRTNGLRGRERHLQEFIQYWQSLRKDGDVPRRTEIDPRKIEPLLENALIAEKVAPGLARMRIAGSHLSDLMGMEVRGMPLSAFVEPSDRPALADALNELFERPAIIDLKLASAGGMGRPAINGRLLLLPLRSDLGDISRAVGAFVTDGQLGRVPRRFQITSQSCTPISADAMAPSPVAVGFAEEAMPFEAAPTAHRSERPYLRVVK